MKATRILDHASGHQRLRDPGLQSERTALAWNRTALAGLTNGGLALRAGIVSDQWPIMMLGGILLVTAVAIITFGVLRKSCLANGEHVLAPRPTTMAATTAFALFACATAFAVLALKA
jgi:uncharacterized membrane protein YidH (DUF202 family)